MHDVPENLLYSKDHEWIEIDGDIGTIGISDHAQAELSDVVFVDLPEVGATVAAGDPVAVVESVKAASDVYTPVSGEILEVNEELPMIPPSSTPILTEQAGCTKSAWTFPRKRKT